MAKNKLRLRGTSTVSAFIKGFVDGRMHTAELDNQTQNLNSAFISSRICRFDELCCNRVIQLVNDLSAVRIEADVLAHEISELPGNDIEATTPSSEIRPATAAEARNIRDSARDAADKAEKSRKKVEKRKEIIRRLTEIENITTKKERICREELSAVADRLERCFCVYCHGALLKPVYKRYIPEVRYEKKLEGYLSDYVYLKQKIREILDKEEDENV